MRAKGVGEARGAGELIGEIVHEILAEGRDEEVLGELHVHWKGRKREKDL